jgi:hypothetical protein
MFNIDFCEILFKLLKIVLLVAIKIWILKIELVDKLFKLLLIELIDKSGLLLTVVL